jgi:hypothetical protein
MTRKKHTEGSATGRARESLRQIKVPAPLMESWYSDLQSALVLIQEMDYGMKNGNRSSLNSLMDGAHALIDRVAESLDDEITPS